MGVISSAGGPLFSADAGCFCPSSEREVGERDMGLSPVLNWILFVRFGGPVDAVLFFGADEESCGHAAITPVSDVRSYSCRSCLAGNAAEVHADYEDARGSWVKVDRD